MTTEEVLDLWVTAAVVAATLATAIVIAMIPLVML
jgi:hypothetical protein